MPGQCCCAGETHGSMRCYSVESAEQCQGQGCSYQEGGKPVPCVGANMVSQRLVTPVADRPEMLAAVDDTYETMYDVRDLLLTSDLGRRVLDYGKSCDAEIARIAADDPDLGSRIFHMGMKAMSFARLIDRERMRPGSTLPQRRFLREDYEFGASVADDVRQRTSNDAVIAAMDDLQQSAAQFVGLSPAEALRLLEQGPTATTPATAS